METWKNNIIVGDLNGPIRGIIINNYYLMLGTSFSTFSFSFQVVVTIDTPFGTIILASKGIASG